MSTAPAPTQEPPDDPAEMLYLLHRKQARRQRLVVILFVTALVLTFVGWKAGTHWIASKWLGSNGYQVDWGTDAGTWKQGGVTTVRFGYHFDIFDIFDIAHPVIDMKFLAWLHRVEELDLSQAPPLRDGDLVVLDKLTDLRSLDLDRSRHLAVRANQFGYLTDATLDRISRLRKLENLTLGGQQITDLGLAKLESLTELKSIDLRTTDITDAAFAHFRKLPALKSLDLTGTKVTAQGVRDFEAVRPGVVILTSPFPTKTPGPKASSTTAKPGLKKP